MARLNTELYALLRESIMLCYIIHVTYDYVDLAQPRNRTLLIISDTLSDGCKSANKSTIHTSM